MELRFVTTTIALTLFFLTSAASAQERPGHLAGDSVFRGAIGLFQPAGDSAYWDEKQRDFTGDIDDFDDVSFELAYQYFVNPRVGLMLSMGGWEGSSTQSYRDFIAENGREISHVTQVDQFWLDFGVVFHFFDKRAAIMPYIGAGGSFISYELSEEGEFIDFDIEPPPVIRDRFFADGDAFGFFLLVGFEVPVSDTVFLYAEGRWRDAEDELNRSFAGLGTFDLSGRSVSGGIALTF
jgi:outer membrane protein W